MKNKKTEIQVVSKTLMVQLGIPVEIGPIKTTSILQLFIYYTPSNGIEFNVDEYDLKDTTYMGMEISDDYKSFNKLRDFHKEMGVDLDKLISDETHRLCSSEMIAKWVEENVTNELMKK